jgi:hypothetical protein
MTGSVKAYVDDNAFFNLIIKASKKGEELKSLFLGEGFRVRPNQGEK